MNERIRELMGNTLDEKFAGTWSTMDMQDLTKFSERFAELILIEVTDILSTYRGKVVFTDGAEYNYEHPIIAIRKHFGVKL